MIKEISISLCMIVKNEEDTIERILNSVIEAVDEIIIVDTGSEDRTKELAKEFGAKVYDFEWKDDFSAARNYSFSLATSEYILWLDADDILDEADKQKLIALKQSFDDEIDSVTMNYILGEDEEGNVVFSLRRNRLVKRDKNFKWIGAVHEYLNVQGKSINGDINIRHKKQKAYTDRNLQIYRRLIKEGQDLSERDMFYYANELYYNGYYNEAIEQYDKFLERENAWVEDRIIACNNAADSAYRQGNKDLELKYVLKSFEFDVPRADFCCRLGYHFLTNNNYKQAIYWYETATKLQVDKERTSMVNMTCHTWLPHIQLCVCYSRVGEYLKAYNHNEEAAKYIPNNYMVLYNREYLKERLSDN